MHNTIERLREWGCDIPGAMARFLNDEEFFLSFLPVVADDPTFEGLGEALRAGDTKKAFECAHSLKGVLGNMGLTPLYVVSCELVEPLRQGETTGVAEKYDELMRAREEFRGLI